MGRIQLTRVDDRLIHGQVMTKWAKGFGLNAIFIIDNDVAKDDFMKQIYISSGSRTGLTIKVFNTNDVCKYWEETKFEDYKVLLLFKSITTVYEAVNNGLLLEELNVGGVSKKKDSNPIISSVSLTEHELGLLNILAQNQKMEIYFQTIPDSNKIMLKDWIKK
jgi:D-glucosaminate PTS system EIIB component